MDQNDQKNIAPIDRNDKWREDFPVDHEKEEFVERREFTKFLILISASFAVGQLYVLLKSKFRRIASKPSMKPIAKVDEIKVGNFIQFSYPNENDTNTLIRLAESEFIAFSNKCTHLMCPVVPQIEENKFHCPCHAGYFDLRTGAPLSGPPRRKLPEIKLKIINNTVYALNVIP